MRVKILKAYVFFTALIMPLMVIKTTYMSRLYTYAFASPYEYAVDHYLVFRTIFFVVFSAIIAVVLLTDKKGRIGIVPVLFVCLLLLSTALSKDRLLSVAGCDEQFEGIFVLLAYAVAFYASKNLAGYEGSSVFIRRMLCLSLLLNSLICIFQGAVMSVKAYGTLYNPNYAGFFLAVLIPEVLWSLIAHRSVISKQSTVSERPEKKGFIVVIDSVFFRAVVLIFAVIALCMTGARTAMAAAFISAAIMIFYRFFPNRKSMFIPCSVVMVILMIFLTAKFVGAGAKPHITRIRDVAILEDGIGFDMADDELTVAFDMPDEDHYYFMVKNASGEDLPYAENREGTMYEIKDDRYEDFSFTIVDYGSFKGFLVYTDGRTWYFYRDSQGEYFYLNGYTRPEKFVRAPFAGFEGNESFASNRGYIWSRTLGLYSKKEGPSSAGIKEIMTGSGPDTFSTVFLQNDVNKYLLTDIPYKMIITRPHSIYLQTVVQLGLPILLLLVWFGIALFSVSVKRGDTVTALTLFVLFFCGVFYDSTPIVMPVFLLIAGMGAGKECIEDKDE